MDESKKLINLFQVGDYCYIGGIKCTVIDVGYNEETEKRHVTILPRESYIPKERGD